MGAIVPEKHSGILLVKWGRIQISRYNRKLNTLLLEKSITGFYKEIAVLKHTMESSSTEKVQREGIVNEYNKSMYKT